MGKLDHGLMDSFFLAKYKILRSSNTAVNSDTYCNIHVIYNVENLYSLENSSTINIKTGPGVHKHVHKYFSAHVK